MAATKEDEKLVREGFERPARTGKLGAVLMQFPFSFHRNAETTEYLVKLLRRFADFPLWWKCGTLRGMHRKFLICSVRTTRILQH